MRDSNCKETILKTVLEVSFQSISDSKTEISSLIEDEKKVFLGTEKITLVSFMVEKK